MTTAQKNILPFSRETTMQTMQNLPEPLTPPDVDIRDFGDMPIDVSRVLNSKFSATVDPVAGFYGMLLWCASWHRVPSASLPNDDRQLCHLAGLGRDLATWEKIKDEALYGWCQCSDGNLYHPVIAEKALVAWIEKLHQRIKSGRGNAARWGCEFSEESDLIAKFHDAWGMLKSINSNSKLILKGNPLENTNNKSTYPTGIPSGNEQGIPDQSQGKVRKGKGREDNNIPPIAPPIEQPEEAPAKQSPKPSNKAATSKFNPDLLNTDEYQNRFREVLKAEGIKSTTNRWKLVSEDFADYWVNSGSNAAKYKKADWLKTWENHVRKQANHYKNKWKAEDNGGYQNGKSNQKSLADALDGHGWMSDETFELLQKMHNGGAQ